MKGHSPLRTRTWILLMAAVVLSVGHIVLPFLVAHAALSATVVSGVIVVIRSCISDYSARCSDRSALILDGDEKLGDRFPAPAEEPFAARAADAPPIGMDRGCAHHSGSFRL
jgi:hypothetical protein